MDFLLYTLRNLKGKKKTLIDFAEDLSSCSSVRCSFFDRNLHSRMPLVPRVTNDIILG